MPLYAIIFLMNSLLYPQYSVWQRGKQLSRSLSAFYTLAYIATALLLLMGVAGLIVGLNLTSQLGQASATSWILFGIGSFIILLTVASAALNLRILRSAKEALQAVTHYAGANEALQTGKVSEFVRWLSIGQWVALVMGIISALIGLSSGLLSGLLGNIGKDASAFNMVIGMASGVGAILRNVIQVVLTWLILEALKQFCIQVIRRARGEGLLVSPSAKTAGNWLMFIVVVLALSLLFLIGGAGLAILGAAAGARGEATGLILLTAVLPLLFILALEIWEMILLLQTRGLMNDVGLTLDQTVSGNMPQVTDAWDNAVIEQH